MAATTTYLTSGDQAINGTRYITIVDFDRIGECPNCTDRHCRRYTTTSTQPGPMYVWHCQTRPRLAEGQSLTRPVGDRELVRVRCVRPGHAYQVTTETVAPLGVGTVLTIADFGDELEARRYGNLLVDTRRAADDLTSAAADSRYQPLSKLAVRGAWLEMSTQQAAAIHAAGNGGTIRRGRGPGKLTDTQIRAAHSRGWAVAYYRTGDTRQSIDHAVVTSAGYAHAQTIRTRQTTAA